MDTQQKTVITVENTVNAPVAKVWEYWTKPEHITKWNAASDDWHTPWAKNDLRVGGTFAARMEAKDGSFGFEFAATYTEVKPNEKLAFTMGDGRKCTITFTPQGNATHVAVAFEAESQNPVEMQKGGWQAILDNYKTYTENN